LFVALPAKSAGNDAGRALRAACLSSVFLALPPNSSSVTRRSPTSFLPGLAPLTRAQGLGLFDEPDHKM
jgi:hypothetical protein